MKKIIALALSLVMMLALCVPAFATDITEASDPKTSDVVVKTTTTGASKTENYTVTIPADFTIVWGTTTATDASKLQYTVTSQLVLGSSLTVSIEDTKGASKRTLTPTAAVPSTSSVTDPSLAYTQTGFAAQSFGEINNAATPATAVTMTISDWSKAPITEYKTTLTYTVAYVPAA